MKRLFFLLLFWGCFFTAPAQYLPRVNKATLAVIREQQKLSRDVYCVLHDKWDLRIFDEIAGAEQNHMESVKALLEQYDVADPVDRSGDEQGKFVYKPLQKIYDSLVVAGTASLEGALRAGAFLAEMNIVDLHKAVKATGAEDLKAVYKYMKMGAERHLLTFARQLKKLGVSYEPVLLGHKEYDRLIGASGGGTGMVPPPPLKAPPAPGRSHTLQP